MGKGDTLRPVDKEKYDANFERVFGTRKPTVWENPPRFTDGGELISGTGDAVEQDDGGRTDPPASEKVEGEGCPPEGLSFREWNHWFSDGGKV